MASISDEEISRRVDARIPEHRWARLGWRLLFPTIAIAVVLPFALLVFPERLRPIGYVLTFFAAIYANHLRDKRVIEHNYKRGLLWEDLYRKSRKPHRFLNCRIYCAEGHPAGYLYFLAMNDGRLIECVSEDVYYGFRDGFPDELALEGDAESDSIVVPIDQSGTRDLADAVRVEIPDSYRASTLRVYRDSSEIPEDVRQSIRRSEQASDGDA